MASQSELPLGRAPRGWNGQSNTLGIPMPSGVLCPRSLQYPNLELLVDNGAVASLMVPHGRALMAHFWRASLAYLHL